MAYNYSAFYQAGTSKHGTGGCLNLRRYRTQNSQLPEQIPNSSPINCSPNSESDDWIACKHGIIVNAMDRSIQGILHMGKFLLLLQQMELRTMQEVPWHGYRKN